MKKSTQHTTIPYILLKMFLYATVNAIRSISGTGRNRTECKGNNPAKHRKDHQLGQSIMRKTRMTQVFTHYLELFAQGKGYNAVQKFSVSFKEMCGKLTLTHLIRFFCRRIYLH